jgi:hypothetical protein
LKGWVLLPQKSTVYKQQLQLKRHRESLVGHEGDLLDFDLDLDPHWMMMTSDDDLRMGWMRDVGRKGTYWKSVGLISTH